MEFTKSDMNMTKGVAILFMLLLHLFCRKEINGLYETFIYINDVPLLYYFSLFGDACVPMYCFASGYGLYTSYKKTENYNVKKNLFRITKLLTNFWIILFLFVAIGFFAGNAEKYPGSITEFSLNFFVLSNSYNGAWWFLQTYIILVLVSPLIFKMIIKYNSFLLLIIVGFIYFVSYVQRIKHILDFSDYPVVLSIVNATVLVGTSLLPFIIGSIFAKEKIYSKFHQKMNGLPHKNTISVIGILLLIVIHSIYESMIIAPITGIIFICFFNVMNKKDRIKKVLNYFGNHSTNIWLTHMFFYMTMFSELTFAPKYPIFIYAWLIVLCLMSSYLIKVIFNPISIQIDKMSVANINRLKRIEG
ncbi:acyltransferase [Lederbergia wuyishanensis]|uniref:Surface polysaccharide O-acyltransferase-like enzyme n=1 Tax=Lederbergia wuyishanensis TaxID=1347903 RepID=A0ABU0D7S5_9BACI|nr:acyltransferase [Lederbergia wuyishanensis]MCJ8009136.1 acyltransferase [Lederbergia wuyishanensis]MDQ0344476.1 surface polysaccharide O-acyltransferase-like enzyme [Lederbergia wuyishanensis]